MTSPVDETRPQAATPAGLPAAPCTVTGVGASYAPPRLTTFGTVAILTATVGATGRSDRGRGTKRRTGY